jgi:histone acetyltransferase (RNA polymerase elongator complex component)
MIIPFFIPQSGCPHQCVFCNQRLIIGRNTSPEASSVSQKIKDHLHTAPPEEPVQVAFYGGTFTALPVETQKSYLEEVQPFLQTGQIRTIRLSTRPDYIDPVILSLLQAYHVTIVELGAQSMDDRVLTLSGRGHRAVDTERASTLLKERGFIVGLQLMPGLPGDSADIFRDTVGKVIKLRPDLVRLYPALVIKDTPLEELYRTGRYQPLSLEAAVAMCRVAFLEFERAGIRVIRMGLQPAEDLEKPGTIIAGPFHPAFGQLVESSVLLDRMRYALRNRKEKTATAVLCVNPREISAAIGQRRVNIETLKKEFDLQEVHIVAGNRNGRRGKVMLLTG